MTETLLLVLVIIIAYNALFGTIVTIRNIILDSKRYKEAKANEAWQLKQLEKFAYTLTVIDERVKKLETNELIRKMTDKTIEINSVESN